MGDQATGRVWRCANLWVIGHATAELEAAEDSGTVISGPELLSLAERITQVIDGDFMGRRPSEEFDSIRIHAIDSTFWEVFGDEGCLDRVRSAFSDVRLSRLHYE